AEAEAARVARTARIDRHAHAGNEMRDAGTHLLDDAGDLVAERHRLPDAHGAEAAVAVVVQVGPADAAGLDAHAHLERRGRDDGHLFNPQIPGSVDDAT